MNRHGLTSKAYIGSELDIFFRYEVKVWREVTYDVSKRKLGFVLQHNTGNRVIAPTINPVIFQADTSVADEPRELETLMKFNRCSDPCAAY